MCVAVVNAGRAILSWVNVLDLLALTHACSVGLAARGAQARWDGARRTPLDAARQRLSACSFIGGRIRVVK
jgi:hypothetical protein